MNELNDLQIAVLSMLGISFTIIGVIVIIDLIKYYGNRTK